MAAVQGGLDVKSCLVEDEIIVRVDRIVSVIQVGENFWAFQVSRIPENFLDLLLVVPDKVKHFNQEHVDVDLVERKSLENPYFGSCGIIKVLLS